MNTKTENSEEISFKAYYENLETDEKNRLRDLMYDVGMANSTFYYKARSEKWTPLELKELRSLTGRNFTR